MFLRICAVYFWYLLVIGWLEHVPTNGAALPASIAGIGLVLSTTIAVPIGEELVMRYWLYGKRPTLRIGYLFSFLAYIAVLAYKIYYEVGNTVPIYVTFLSLVFLGLFLGYLLRTGSVNVTKIINIFDALSRSWLMFGIILFCFLIAHAQSISDVSFFYLQSYLPGAFIITYAAKKYGIKLSILMHIINNTLALNISIANVYVFENIEQGYFYLLFPVCVALLGVYHYWIYRLKKNPEYTPRLWFPN